MQNFHCIRAQFNDYLLRHIFSCVKTSFRSEHFRFNEKKQPAGRFSSSLHAGKIMYYFLKIYYMALTNTLDFAAKLFVLTNKVI